MEQHGGSSNNLGGSLADNTSQSNISVSSMAQQPQSRPMTGYQPQSYQQLHQQYAQQQSVQPKNMYAPQPQQSQSPKPMTADMYDQQQLMRTQSQSSNSQYGLNNKASIASTSSTSNQGAHLQQYGQQLPRGQPHMSSKQQAIGNPNAAGFQMSSAAYQQQQQELQKKRQTMPESVSEMLRKR